MKNKRYRELAAILVMMTMAAGQLRYNSNSTGEHRDCSRDRSRSRCRTVEDAENADSEAAETADTQSQATALEVTDRFAQQTAVDEALLQEASERLQS